tara:strand:- start:8042 stop:8665 length:624 start_codon:yes stop_codon:yes gene_type:complete
MKKNKFLFILSFIVLFGTQLYGSQAWKSMVLPGMGQNELGHKDRAKLFLLSEYILWSSFIFSDNQYSSYRSDYKSYGEQYAGVNWDHKNDLFASHVGNYDSLELYNLLTLQNGLLENYTDEDYSDTSPFHDYYWNWNGNRENRIEFDKLRNKSENYDKAKNFVVAGIVLNRIISFLDVVILERKNILTSEVLYDYNKTASFNLYYNF